jgi:HD domain
MPTVLTSRFDEAVLYAIHLHAAQRRKGTDIPYVAHLFAVASLVISHGGDEDEAIAGLLHDAVEDQGGKATLEAIRARFGQRVADIVEGCTDTDEVPKPPWRQRKERYLKPMHGENKGVGSLFCIAMLLMRALLRFPWCFVILRKEREISSAKNVFSIRFAWALDGAVHGSVVRNNSPQVERSLGKDVWC